MVNTLSQLIIGFAKRGLVVILTGCITVTASGQFAPPAGQAGSTAISKDSSIIKAWAVSSTIVRGWQDISDTTVGRASAGDSSSPVGIANGSIVSLGDGGTATLVFNKPITNGAGPDFAVFENGFSDSFLEVAFVEVSSDGQRFVRFPAVSDTQDTAAIGSFGELDATKLNNLAGKYRANYGTPFDLEELNDSAGLDVSRITHVRVIDCVGSLNPLYATYDKNGSKVNDPWPTPFASSGFDLDAVGVIHELITSGIEENSTVALGLYPNPASDFLNIQLLNGVFISGEIYDVNGHLLMAVAETKIDITALPDGFYFFHIKVNNNNVISKFIVSR
jgi:hypothetical protein